MFYFIENNRLLLLPVYLLLLMYAERRKQERREETEARRRTWQERFAERSDNRAAGTSDAEETARKRPGLLHTYCIFMNV